VRLEGLSGGAVKIIDRYILRLTMGPLTGTLGVTLVALLLERVLRLLQLLSNSSNRFGFVSELAFNLVPHYLGLTLPVAFFVALFVVVTRLNENSEIDALLASGVSLTRIVAPYVCLGAALMVVSLALFGFAQPYSRYGYRAVLNAAQSGGWNGVIQPQAFFNPDDSLTMTADAADASGESLRGVFIRKRFEDGREEITTAGTATLRRNLGGRSVTLSLQNGQQLSAAPGGGPRLLAFESFSMQLPINGFAKLLRPRGGDERELTLLELAQEAANPNAAVPRQTLLGELYARLARSFSLPLLPLLALPLGLAAKRGGRAPGIILAGLLLLAFQHLLQLGQGLASGGRALAFVSVGGPFFIFAALCIGVFVSSRKRPGQNPISHAVEATAHFFKRFKLRRRKAAAA
jgi:lipopolysaccharide export system permease protein